MKLDDRNGHEARSVSFHTTLLLLYFGPLVILAKQLALPIDHGIRVLGAPPVLGGLLVAVLVLAPELLAAARAALMNELQRSINILLGLVLATISLTIPTLLTLGLMTGKTITLGLEPVDQVLLLLTLLSSTMTFSRNRTNVLQGAVHVLLFLAYLMLIFEHQKDRDTSIPTGIDRCSPRQESQAGWISKVRLRCVPGWLERLGGS